MSCIQEQPTEGVRPNARENGRTRPSTKRFGLPEVLAAVSTSRLSCKRAGETRTLMPVWDSSGESQLICHHSRAQIAAMAQETEQARHGLDPRRRGARGLAQGPAAGATVESAVLRPQEPQVLPLASEKGR